MIKKIFFVILFCATGINLFAWRPDSVYIGTNNLLFYYYADTAVHVKEISFDGQNKMEIEERLANRQDSTYYLTEHLYGYDQFRLNSDCEHDLLGYKIPLSYENGYHDYTFFAPDRYAAVRWEKDNYNEGKYKKDNFTLTNVWKQCAVDNLNFGVLYDLHSYFREKEYHKRKNYFFDPEQYEYNIEGFVLPMDNGKYLLSTDYKQDTIFIPQRQDYTPVELLYSRQLMKDTDTLLVSGKYGLYTMTGLEVIPAIYDSLRTEEILIRAFRDDGRIDLINYMGEKIRENLRAAYPVQYRYQIVDDDGKMYFLDREGNETDSFSYSFMSVDDLLLPLGLDIVLLPPQKLPHLKQKYKKYTWVNFSFPYDYWKYESLKRLRHPSLIPTEEDWEQLRLNEKYNISNIYQHKWNFENNVVERYGLDRIEWHKLTYCDQRSEMYGYEIEAYDIPSKYKDLKLISGEDKYYRSGDYVSLPSSWIIAKRNGKYGVIDVRESNETVLPFIYDDIKANYRYMILRKKGLVCYYPISSTPRYKKLESFTHYFARFQLADGRLGWLAKNGKEYIDNE